MSSDLRARLEALMAFDEKLWALEKGQSDARYQHARDLEVLRKMAACLEKISNHLGWIQAQDTLGKAQGCAFAAQAEIARLVEGK